MEIIASSTTFTILIGLAVGLTGIFSLVLLFLLFRDWANKNLW